jgi:predicted ATPase
MTKNITILGLDGTGKSTLMKTLLQACPIKVEEIAIINAPNFHEGEDVPLSTLSRHLEIFSSICDSLESFELKATSLYLQATLFGIVENFFKTTLKPKIIISQRNPLLDSLVYGEFYVKMIHSKIDQKKFEPQIIQKLQEQHLSWNKILNWFELHTQRIETQSTFWDFPLEIKKNISI